MTDYLKLSPEELSMAVAEGVMDWHKSYDITSQRLWFDCEGKPTENTVHDWNPAECLNQCAEAEAVVIASPAEHIYGKVLYYMTENEIDHRGTPDHILAIIRASAELRCIAMLAAWDELKRILDQEVAG